MIRLLFDMAVPLTLAFVSLWGMIRGVDVYGALITGAGDGLRMMGKLIPAMVALLTAVYMLRASGILDRLGQFLSPLLSYLGVPPETVPLVLMRPVSGSAALGIGAELMNTYGPDSVIGRTAAVMLGSTETTFYTVAVYFGAAGIKRTRYAIPAALCADTAAFLAASWTVRFFFQ